MARLLKTLINASEKAANIARSCVGINEESDALLVAEKSDGEANTRFDKDFKTIADVLAQEAAKSTIINDFPVLTDNVHGEECSEIGGKKVELFQTEAQTEELLQSLVTSKLAMRMAKAAHRDINDPACPIPDDLPELDASNLGIWIDPIDATAEFIAGVQGKAKSGEGLQCVTVLIGAYLRSTGEPVLGVINQPFYENGKGRILWGLCFGGIHKWDGTDIGVSRGSNIILMSNAEESSLKWKFENSSYKIDTAPGAGNKLMQVCLGEAKAYVLSKGTTFYWDTCAPQAILKATGGNVINFKSREPIKYISKSENIKQYCNSDGIIAYNGDIILNEFLTALE